MATSTPTDTGTPTPTATHTATPTSTPTETPTAGPLTISYTYDGLQRLTVADHSDGRYYHYSYDAVGNRLTYSDPEETVEYEYDAANRLIRVDEVEYTWDDNGNLLDDGVNEYSYDAANRLIEVTGPSGTSTYAYDGLGNRYQQTVNEVTTTYTLDIAAGLTQVLGDGTNTYYYGVGRIAQVDGEEVEYFLGDALRSVRQMADENGSITLLREYDPYGNVLGSEGEAETMYGYDAEQTDFSFNLINLRSRLYDPASGRFLSRDSWQGDYYRPQSLNRWCFVEEDPINYIDPSGYIAQAERQEALSIVQYLKRYQVDLIQDWGYSIPITMPPTIPLNLNCMRWREGSWSLTELQIVLGAIANIDIAMNQKMATLVGPTTIMKSPSACGRGCTSGNKIKLLDRGLLPSSAPTEESIHEYLRNDRVDPSINFDQWTIVHEIGHVWDNHNLQQLSFRLMLATGGMYLRVPGCDHDKRKPGCNNAYYYYGDTPPVGSDANFNPREDFAESFAAFVFPDEAYDKVQNMLYKIQHNVDPIIRNDYTTYFNLFYYTNFRNTERGKYIAELISQ
jgi:RHS repeat-associated protein